MTKILVLINLLFLNCSAPKQNKMDDPELVEINFHQVICQGEGKQWCLQLKQGNEKSWTYQYDIIEGLDYQWGYRYFISVDKKSIKNPPQDGSSIKTVLKSIIKKEKIPFNSTVLLDLSGEVPSYDAKSHKITILEKDFAVNKNLKILNTRAIKKIKLQFGANNKFEVTGIF